MFRRPAVIVALASAAISGVAIGATALVSPVVAIAAFGAIAAAGIALSLDVVSQRIESATARIESRLTLDQLQNGNNDWRLTTDYTTTPDLIWIVVEELMQRHAKVLVELGAGVSTLVLARIIRRQGLGCKFISIEHDPKYAVRIRDELRAEGLQNVVNLVEAPLEPVTVEGYQGPWYSRDGWLENLEPIDILLVDGPQSCVTRRFECQRFRHWHRGSPPARRSYSMMPDESPSGVRWPLGRSCCLGPTPNTGIPVVALVCCAVRAECGRQAPQADRCRPTAHDHIRCQSVARREG